MIVEIDQDILNHSDSLDLLALFHLGNEGRHVFISNPPFDTTDKAAPITQWAQQFNESIQAAIALTFDEGIRLGTARPPSIQITTATNINHLSSPPRLCISQALKLLRSPVKALVENINTDHVFIEKILPPEARRRYQEAIRNGWLEIFNGGGLDPMTQLVKSVRKRSLGGDPWSHLLWWTLFDSDTGGQPQKSLEFEDTCCKNRITHHRLQRREAENYLPLPLLERWSEQSQTQRDQRKQIYRRFKNLLPVQRHTTDVKATFCDNGILSLLADTSIPSDILDAWLDRDCASEREAIAESLMQVL